ncbi:hypothetical protein Cme02nite_63310 [Catellatospora methionotrophica]|uniref:Uncharacterized protein n=1 Tax=Catellatospora methionotrophica TaxID=121620 RepID=A0A8J3LFT2_9ACTN|nr:hypothetical protein [Catellatospora methionotrophica]GIG17999.1 hypothetical protein Cme02nite_63310 [Catellatospora methionotrophica]
MGSNKCIDVWLDFDRDAAIGESDHYDARVARSCQSMVSRDTLDTYETTDVTGVLKLGACYGNNNATTSPLSNCTQVTGTLTGVVPAVPNNCTRAWVMTAGGKSEYFDGGVSTSCSS